MHTSTWKQRFTSFGRTSITKSSSIFKVPQKYNQCSICLAAVYLTLPKINSGAQHPSCHNMCGTVFVPVCGSSVLKVRVCDDMNDRSKKKRRTYRSRHILGESDESVELPGLDTFPFEGSLVRTVRQTLQLLVKSHAPDRNHKFLKYNPS